MAKFKQAYLGLFLLIPVTFTFQSCDSILPFIEALLQPVEQGLSKEQIVKGLKEALKVGTDTAVTRLTRKNGFYGDKLLKIGLPKEANLIVENIAKIPLIGQAAIDKTTELINRAAEDAATEAKPIFINAITNMTIADGFALLHGEDSAATAYLRKNTYQQLFNAFKPKIENSLSKKIVGNVSAESSYSTLIDNYNKVAKIPLSGLTEVKTNTLSSYATNMALKGLFVKVLEEEKDIRHDVKARVSDLLKQVFGELDK
ncbi:MAG: DUF4197 domain-containing protein [Bacteroidetes bacterium]|nr:DUF4197 domain-containing protein [Bacteroidota bacterium]